MRAACAYRIVVFPDGSFVVSTVYDEAGIPLRYHAASGQPLSGSALAEKDIWDIAAEGSGQTLICGIEKKLVRIVPPGERTRMANGAENYPVLAGGERLATEADGKKERLATGLAVVEGVAYVGLPGLDLVRGIDLKTGRKTADWKVPAVADVRAGEKGTLWAISGTDVVQLKIGRDGSGDHARGAGFPGVPGRQECPPHARIHRDRPHACRLSISSWGAYDLSRRLTCHFEIISVRH